MMPWPGGVQQDFLEVPSMMLEQFVYRKDVLERLSSHFETKKPLDDDSVKSLSDAKHFLSAWRVRDEAQILYSMVAMRSSICSASV